MFWRSPGLVQTSLSRCAPGRADTRRDLTRATRATRRHAPSAIVLTFLSAGANDATLAGTSTRGRRGDPDRDARRVARGLPSLSTRQHPAGPVPGGPGGPARPRSVVADSVLVPPRTHLTYFPPRALPDPQLVLDKESFTLEELLEEDDVIQECKSLNSRLIN